MLCHCPDCLLAVPLYSFLDDAQAWEHDYPVTSNFVICYMNTAVRVCR